MRPILRMSLRRRASLHRTPSNPHSVSLKAFMPTGAAARPIFATNGKISTRTGEASRIFLAPKSFVSSWGEASSDNRRLAFPQEATLYEVILKSFERPDEIRKFDKGKFELVHIHGMTIGRATYEPGWKWSEHVGRAMGAKSCSVEHVGTVVSGRATAAMDDGRVIEMKAGDVFYIAPGHDSWVVGDEPYVSLHLMGASDYAQEKLG